MIEYDLEGIIVQPKTESTSFLQKLKFINKINVHPCQKSDSYANIVESKSNFKRSVKWYFRVAADSSGC